MPHIREIKTCDRCRHFKRRCDLVKPACTRCVQAGIRCSFQEASGGTGAVSLGPAPVDSLNNLSISESGRSSLPSQTGDHDMTSSTAPDSFKDSLFDNTGGPDAMTTQSTADANFDSKRSFDAANFSVAVSGNDSTTSSSLPDFENRPAAEPRVVRKRRRNCLSCLRCHRLKVKCDKELPCARCKSSGNGRECYYSYNKGPNGGKFQCPPAPGSTTSQDENRAIMATWEIQHKVRGSSHWRDLMAKIGTLSKAKSSTLTPHLEYVATNACLANFTLPGNFPFGTPAAAKYYSRETVTKLIATEKDQCEEYIERYLELLEPVNPVFAISKFRQEVEKYWQNPGDASLSWMACFLMVLGLGCFSAIEEPPIATEFMMAAEACLMQTPFMFRPSLHTLKAMTLMVVAKQTCNATCWSVDSCWSLLGLLVRSAYTFGLPQEENDRGEELRDEMERDARMKLWLTILYLDVKVSMSSGMPPLTRPNETGGLRISSEWKQPDTIQVVLQQSLPTVLAILTHLNSQQDHISYPDVMRYSSQIRQLMRQANRVCTNILQRITIDIFLRRCLMVLHRPFALHHDGPVLFPESYWSSLECSLALLMHYRDLWCTESGMRWDLVGRPFVLDFFSATLTTSVHVLREDAPLAEAEAIGCQIPPRQIILDTLQNCVDIWEGEVDKSVCWRTGYNLMATVLAMLPETSTCP